MNERIAALIDQMNKSGLLYQAGDYEMTVAGGDLEYFAELIVRECLSYAKDGDLDFMKFMIKKNFGVEE